MIENVHMRGQDIPIDQLLPVRERNTNLDRNQEFRRLLSTAKALGLITRMCADELAFVKHERQLQILAEMKAANDYSLSLARAMVVKTPPRCGTPARSTRRPGTREAPREWRSWPSCAMSRSGTSSTLDSIAST